MKDEKKNPHLTKALAKIGSNSEVARRLTAMGKGITHQAVSSWERKGKLPVERVLDIERLSGVSRHDLRRDIYGPRPRAR